MKIISWTVFRLLFLTWLIKLPSFSIKSRKWWFQLISQADTNEIFLWQGKLYLRVSSFLERSKSTMVIHRKCTALSGWWWSKGEASSAFLKRKKITFTAMLSRMHFPNHNTALTNALPNTRKLHG